MGGRKSHAALMADDDERNPFEDEISENSEVDAGNPDQEEGGGIKPPPDHPIGTEVLHADAEGVPRWLKRIYDCTFAARELGGEDFDERFGDDKLRARSKALKAMADDPMQGWRPMTVASDAMIADLVALADAAPNFRALFEVVISAARASLLAAMPLRLPPLLLVGPPGAGKSRAAFAMASALQTSIEKVPVTMQTGAGVLSGLDWSWRSPSMGAVARALLTAQTACPILVIDEIDKSSPRSEYGQLLDPLHDLLESDTARHFVDEYLKLPLAADGVLWIATANDLAPIPASITDRMLLLEVQQPTPSEMGVILRAMIQAAIIRWGDWFPAEIDVDPGTISALRSIHPRAARRVIDLAVGFAVAAGRRVVLADDVERARMITISPKMTRKIGFL